MSADATPIATDENRCFTENIGGHLRVIGGIGVSSP
jgi:hypothetical protein